MGWRAWGMENYHLIGPETMLWMMKIWGLDNGDGCTTL